MLTATLCVFGAWAGIATVLAVLFYMGWRGSTDEFGDYRMAQALKLATSEKLQSQWKNLANETEQQLATASLMQKEIAGLRAIADGGATIETNLRRELEAAAGRDKQHTLELGQRRGEIQRLQQELAESVRECDIHRNGNDELRGQIKQAKEQHARRNSTLPTCRS